MGISGLFEDIRRLARFRVFDTLSVKVDVLFRMYLVNLLLGLGEPEGGKPKHGFLVKASLSHCVVFPNMTGVAHIERGYTEVEAGCHRESVTSGSRRGVGGGVENAPVFFIPLVVDGTRTMGLFVFRLLGNPMHNRFVLRLNSETETNKSGLEQVASQRAGLSSAVYGFE